MASVQASEIPAEQAFMSDYWNLRKQFYYAEDSDAYWESLVNEVNRIAKKYNSTYTDAILIVCINDIEIRYRDSTGKSLPGPGLLDKIIKIIKRDRETNINNNR